MYLTVLLLVAMGEYFFRITFVQFIVTDLGIYGLVMSCTGYMNVFKTEYGCMTIVVKFSLYVYSIKQSLTGATGRSRPVKILKMV